MKPTQETPKPQSESTPKKRLQNLNILVADDSPDSQFIEELILTNNGASVDLAANGSEAFHKAISKSYDLVLMDVEMPELDGIEATRRLREAGLHTPIIALTGHTEPEEKNKTLRAGCDAHLSKPLDAEQLIATVESLTKSH